MLAVDVNILVYAHRPESPDHDVHRNWLDRARLGDEPLGLSPVVVSGFLRIVTHPRVFVEPTPLEIAIGFAEALMASPAVRRLDPSDRHWTLARDLCIRVGARGNQIPDAFLAALAIEHRATFVTADRGVARYPGLRVLHPADTVD